jgi:predicted Zn-dependent protease
VNARRVVAGVGAVALLLVTCGPAQAQISDRLRRTIESAGNIARSALPISTAKEIEIGRGIAATIAGRYPVSTDTALTAYVNLVGLAVAGEMPRPDIAYRFAVLETPDVNAFAAPGGYIFITRGSLDLIATEAELAAVLAHEVGHVNRRHVIEQLRKTDMLRTVQSEAGLSGSTLDQIVGSGSNLLFTGLSRTDEAAADSIGVELAASVGYDPTGLATFIAKLGSHASEGPLAELTATHPGADDRLRAVQRITQRGGWAGGAVLADRYRRYVPAPRPAAGVSPAK